MNKTKKIISKIISILLVVFIAVPFFPMTANAISYDVSLSVDTSNRYGTKEVGINNPRTVPTYYAAESARPIVTVYIDGVSYSPDNIPEGYSFTYSYSYGNAQYINETTLPTFSNEDLYYVNYSLWKDNSIVEEISFEYYLMNPDYYVMFYMGPGETDHIASQTIKGGQTCRPIEAVEPPTEYDVFVGWYTDEDLTNSFDFNTHVTDKVLNAAPRRTLELYAKWEHRHKLVKVDAVEPTCAKAGKKEYWKCEDPKCEAIFADGDGEIEIEVEEDIVLPIDSNAHDWDDPVYTWSDDESEVTASRKCQNDASHVETETVKTEITVVKEPTDTEDGILQVIATFKNSAFEKQVREYGFRRGAEDEYALISELTEWIKGGKDPLSLRFKNLTDDEGTFDQFLGIEVDGKEVSEENYTKEKGSVIVNLKPEYLEKLSVGEHTIEAMFIYGSVKAKFTIKEAKATEVKAAEAKKEAAKSNATKTGDSSPLLIAIIVMAVSALAIVTMIVVKKKKKN